MHMENAYFEGFYEKMISFIRSVFESSGKRIKKLIGKLKEKMRIKQVEK